MSQKIYKSLDLYEFMIFDEEMGECMSLQGIIEIFNLIKEMSDEGCEFAGAQLEPEDNSIFYLEFRRQK